MNPPRKRGLIVPAAITASVIAAVLLAGRATPGDPACPSTPQCGPLIWHEEFDPSPDGAPNPKHWGYDLGATGWGNEELQEYTADRANSRVAQDGTLQIVLRERAGGAGYTSARLVSRGRVSIGHGYLEARIQLPTVPASGVWPAFWLLGHAEAWPDSGEIDVLETVNGVNGYSTNIHGGPRHWQQFNWHETTAVNDGEWHTYGVLIRSDRLQFFHDGNLVHTVTPAGMPPGGVWPFDVPDRRYYLILNMAMGGSYPGAPDGTAALPATMRVDYVRYWGLGSDD